MSLYDDVLRYVDLGLSVIPVRADGSKRPALAAWKEYQTRRPTDAELEAWFGGGVAVGVAVVCGAVSRCLEVLDFDDATTWAAFRAAHWLALQATKAPVVSTPSGGAHVYLFRRCAGPNRKLAQSEDGRTLIEVRGQGGYVLAPGCPPECHATGRLYEWVRPLAEAAAHGRV